MCQSTAQFFVLLLVLSAAGPNEAFLGGLARGIKRVVGGVGNVVGKVVNAVKPITSVIQAIPGIGTAVQSGLNVASTLSGLLSSGSRNKRTVCIMQS